jgi:hypothetical protein
LARGPGEELEASHGVRPVGWIKQVEKFLDAFFVQH